MRVRHTFKKGDIVRYAGGCSALARLESPHAGGWHATHCLGGTLFVSEDYPRPMQLADADDIAAFAEYRARTLSQQGREET